jgi:hypothetical protein
LRFRPLDLPLQGKGTFSSCFLYVVSSNGYSGFVLLIYFRLFSLFFWAFLVGFSNLGWLYNFICTSHLILGAFQKLFFFFLFCWCYLWVCMAHVLFVCSYNCFGFSISVFHYWFFFFFLFIWLGRGTGCIAHVCLYSFQWVSTSFLLLFFFGFSLSLFILSFSSILRNLLFRGSVIYLCFISTKLICWTGGLGPLFWVLFLLILVGVFTVFVLLILFI